ncbi:YfiT family bacillithiol transferase [Deinococcus maricopensis]|uniref:Putative metal-dependent hydrolase Deima_2902 n=1 Tax=Deinococcus maricopensis (strain DSM 21211 / LMG 22137 / NRRL B-23946 / LB-34) TaxID=709986 RepID=E8UBU2_DEIML|nr:putative metal-dependent hydrolase [Deinococcus maricopensis]ADV68531.1 metal-dependent hydrolase [Deinococcus maricopensis DSM 21211]
MTDERYPIGPAPHGSPPTPAERAVLIAALRALPGEFRAALNGLTDAQLNTPYRDGGWTLRQLAHHVPDSHLNAYIRMKLALTEDAPVIKPYDEGAWAALPDSHGDIRVSLALLDALHARWATLLDGLTDAQWTRAFVHPDAPAPVPLGAALATYVWHGRHHTAHVTRWRARTGA